MKLFLNATSPYARLVRIVILEKALADRVQLCWCDPWGDDPALLSHNPVGRVPTLVCDSGLALSESLLIACYLDKLGDGSELQPVDGAEHDLKLLGLGQGLMDMAFSAVITQKHFDDKANGAELCQRRWRALPRILDALESMMASSAQRAPLTLGQIAVAVALDYLLFRLPGLAPLDGRPALAAWHGEIIRLSSFRQTAFGQ